jgi:hypothetical protein
VRPGFDAEITLWGDCAARALARTEGRVIAVFERSLYLETDGGIACLGAVEGGPLNARCAPLNAPLGAPVRSDSGTLRIGDIVVDLSSAASWHPARLEVGLDLARVAALEPGGGLGAVAVARACNEPIPAHDTLLRQAAPAIDALRRGDLRGAAPLIGLGPGLTPSGDDLIGGYLITRPNDEVAAWAMRHAPRRTNAISAAHLHAAAALQQGAAAFHDALAGGPLEPLLALGHSSGWDMLAGAVLALTSER